MDAAAGPKLNLLDLLQLQSVEVQRAMHQPAVCKALRQACTATRDWVDGGISELQIRLQEGTEQEEAAVARRLGRVGSTLRPTSLYLAAKQGWATPGTHLPGSLALQHPGQQTFSRLTHVTLVGMTASNQLMTALSACPNLSDLKMRDVPARNGVIHNWEGLTALTGLRSLSIKRCNSQPLFTLCSESLQLPALWDAVLATTTQLTSVSVLGINGPNANQCASLAARPSLRSLAFM